ncbi:MAG: TldD/PmbA family protein [Deltaproteobacteria bacterium]|nr:TldD/PmbA family protein [Deltaproteobacteria bacterium]
MDDVPSRFRALCPAVDFASLRVVEEVSERVAVRQDVPEPPESSRDAGAMVTVVQGDGIGHAATADLSNGGLLRALERARAWAELARGRSVFTAQPRLPSRTGRRVGPGVDAPMPSRGERLDRLLTECREAHPDPRIVDWAASLWTLDRRQLLVTADGGEIEQAFRYTIPSLHVTAHDAGRTQTRSWGGRYNGVCRQGALDVLEHTGFRSAGRRTAEEALELLAAPNCPTGTLDVVLLPDQMMLQIHESIGHPIELDRILGDERNYAGTSFVTLDMFGTYRYGSELLDVTYDPTRAEQFATFAFDDDGAVADRVHVIRRGILERPLGGTLSQARAGLPGVATTRAASWNRPPIDRMSNLNVEPGTSTLDDLVAATDDGVLLGTNVSWSIDDSRNKFQFGCEWGRRIRGGKLAEMVRNPNYRGVSATFWRSLVGVGDAGTVDVMGTPCCGKGEPNQAIFVGHASPVCRFAGVAVFGGAA